MIDSEPSLYELLGGETGVRRLVDRFYDLMDSSPEAAQIRAIHPKSLKQSREKLFMFLSGWSGGPQLYIESRGHPALRMRHAPFAIGATERDQWVWCMHKALDEMEMCEQVREYLKNHFADAAEFLRNRD
ncbi:MAG: group II truncated hemoglobin [Chloroflexota bacterium]